MIAVASLVEFRGEEIEDVRSEVWGRRGEGAERVRFGETGMGREDGAREFEAAVLSFAGLRLEALVVVSASSDSDSDHSSSSEIAITLTFLFQLHSWFNIPSVFFS